MIKDHVARFAGVRRRTLFIVMAVMMLLASIVSTSSAQTIKEPTGEFAVFTQCPRLTPELDGCFYSQATGGVVTLNKLTVPITNPITLQGGFKFSTESAVPFVGALNGETLSTTPQPIPGGMASLIDCNEIKGQGRLERASRAACKALFERSRFSAAYETTELAAPASAIFLDPDNDVAQSGVAVGLQVKFHLESPLLGNNCYVGSNAHPIVLNMTTGTTSPPPPNQPITGRYGTAHFNEVFTFVDNEGHALLDNTFAVPAVTGCGGAFSSVVDHLIDSRVGLPAPAGYNTAIHEGFTYEGVVPAVIASEEEIKTGKGGGGGKGAGEAGKKWYERWIQWLSRVHGRH